MRGRIALAMLISLSWAQSKFRGGSYDGGGAVRYNCPPTVVFSAKFRGGFYDGAILAAVYCNTPPPAPPNKWRGGPFGGSRLALSACAPTVLFSAKFAGGPYDGSHEERFACPSVVLVSDKYRGGPYDGAAMMILSCTPLPPPVASKFAGGPYDGSAMRQIACSPVVLVSDRFRGGPYDGEGMTSTGCLPPLAVESEIFLEGQWQYPGRALLRWFSAYDPNALLYVLLRQSETRPSWEVVTALPSAGVSTYEYVDSNLAPGYYLYRVEVLLNNGVTHPSNLVALSYAAQDLAESLLLYPNPTSRTLFLRVVLPYDTPLLIQGWDVQGKLIWEATYTHEAGFATYKADLIGLSSGIYLFKVYAPASGKDWNFRIIKLD